MHIVCGTYCLVMVDYTLTKEETNF